MSPCHCRDAAPSHFLPPLSRTGREQEKPCPKLSDINPITLLMDRASSPTGHCCSQEYPGCSWREAQGGSPGPLLAQCHGNDSQGCAARWHVPERALPALLSAVAQSCRSAPGDPAQLFSCPFSLGISHCHGLRMWISDFFFLHLTCTPPSSILHPSQCA